MTSVIRARSAAAEPGTVALAHAQEQLGSEATPPFVLVTGATGFVGRHVAPAFHDAGFRVRALTRSAARAQHLGDLGFELVTGRLEDGSLLDEACAGVDVVVHLAALTHARGEDEYHRVNVTGTQRLLEAALQQRVGRFVFLSSLAAAGPCIDGRGVSAADQPRPLTAYGRSKLAAEQVCMNAADRIRMVILRAPAVYGPWDTDLFHFFRIAKYGFIPVPTGPERRLQMVHAADLAAALVRGVVAPAARGVYHIAEPRSYSWEAVGRMVGAAVGRRVRALPVPAALLGGLAGVVETAAGLVGSSSIFNRDKARELLAPGWLCETESARAEMGYEARIGLDEGLRATARWYRDNGWL
jgi:nucleoside-diphosphate-sugar epimerase